MTKVKVCGLTSLETMAAAVDYGADYVGLVFYAPSPRNVDAATAAGLASVARGRSLIVALTVDADDLEIAGIIDKVKPDVLQLHGRETPQRVADVKQRFSLPIIKAIAVATVDDVKRAENFTASADLILFDAKPPKDALLPGGNGVAFDWSVLEIVRNRFAFMLSGGLNSGNVNEAIARTTPTAVDVSSGVEIAPGVKDVALIRRFLQTVKTANH